MEFTVNEKYAIVAILELIMRADAVVHPKEVAFMDQVMQQLDISIHDLDHMEMTDFHSIRETLHAMASPQQETAKEWFLKMAEADGSIDPREQDVINRIFDPARS